MVGGYAGLASTCKAPQAPYRGFSFAIGEVMATRHLLTTVSVVCESDMILSASFITPTTLGTFQAVGMMQVTFKHGATWCYSDVTHSVWTAFCESESQGKFYLQNIRGKYTSIQVH
jgi:hypothetical protein